MDGGNLNDITGAVISSALEVHRELGPGLLESAYKACLAYELASRGLAVEREKELPLVYRGLNLDCGYRMDLLVENSIVVELKVVDKILPIHEAQLLSYLRLSNHRIGLLINFKVPILKHGIKRMVNNLARTTATVQTTASEEDAN